MAETAEKDPNFVSLRLLEALGGKKDLSTGLVSEGAFLWGAEDREIGRGILNHVQKVSRVAYFLGKELKKKSIPGFENLDLQLLVEGALLHDIVKLYGEGRERLSLKEKEALGITPDFKEISSEVDNVGISWLKKLGFPSQVYEAIRGHDFPEMVINDPYWKIILIADYMAGQKVMSTKDRLTDVRQRWITQPMERGDKPRIEPERFMIAERNINKVAVEIFAFLNTTDEEFIEKHQLNAEGSETRWEKFLRKTAAVGRESRAKQLVKLFIG